MYNAILLDAGGPIVFIGAIAIFVILPIIALILLIYFFNKYRKRKKQ